MAELLEEPYDGLPDRDEYDDIGEYIDAEDEALGEIREEEDLIQFPHADGYAYYIVVERDPLTLQHVPFGDKYSKPWPFINGLELDYIEDQLD